MVVSFRHGACCVDSEGVIVASKKKAFVPKGYHLMPNGKLMKGAKHEATESKAEKKKEYGPKVRKKK